MKKSYIVPNMLLVRVSHESICVGSQGDINNVRIDDTRTISSGSDFGVKTNTVQWEGWDE